MIRDHIGNSIPGYTGYTPGSRVEADVSFGIPRVCIDNCRHERKRATYDHQAQKQAKKDETERMSRSMPAPRAPMHDNRGIDFPFAGDTQHSRIPPAGEEKFHRQSHLGLTSHAHENQGEFGNLRGFGSATRGIVGYTGYTPGKHAENVFGDGWSKQTERSVASHLRAVRKGPKELTMISAGGTMVAPNSADMLGEKPLKNPSYQHRSRGWSDCPFSGMHVDSAGRRAPRNCQEAYGDVMPAPCKGQIHGYQGWVPGRVGESVVGERQCKTNDISHQLFYKNRMRITQR